MFRKLVAALRSVGRFLNSYLTLVDVHINIGPIGISASVETGPVSSPSVNANISYDKYSHLSANLFVVLLGLYVSISRADRDA